MTSQTSTQPASTEPASSDPAATDPGPASLLARAVLPPIEDRIAAELAVKAWQVRAAVELLDGGSTVPFVARYRKEITGTLDDAQLRTLEERLGYLRELEERRAAVLQSIESQGKLDDALAASVMAAETKGRLEDIYLPYKPKRRTKAQIAREAGLEPLAGQLLNDPATDPEQAAAGFVNEGVDDAAAALAGARSILVERFAEDADLVGELRERLWSRGRLSSAVREGKQEAGAKFKDYFAFSQALTKLPSHRILAMFRGEKEDVLSLSFATGEEDDSARTSYENSIAARFGVTDRGRPADAWLAETVRWAWRTRILMHLELDLRGRLWQIAEDEALRVFSANLRDLLLAAPAGTRATMGLDPGLRTGVKVAVVDATGKVVATDTIYPHPPARKWDAALGALARLAGDHDVELIAIGNGTASRETDKLAGELITQLANIPDMKVPVKAVVSEAGASVYSASAYASAELPELDVSLRGAVSIARRLQDPLAELVKIDPKSIGVGQYQHDLAGSRLSRSLDAVVEDCVNAVGVDLNTASAPLLRRVSGVTETLAASIVAHRDANGPFRQRTALKDVPRLGPKAFEQCAGFMRIEDGDDPLDRSAVHPEAYPVVRRILTATDRDARGLIGDAAALRALKVADFVDDIFGLPTVTDIIAELEKPGRDPRPAFATATFAEGVEKVADLQPGMVLEGVVTNVAAFGAFVDVGVHQDGLVHVSALSRTFVKDPRDAVKPGDVVKVKVLDVDVARKRIGLSLRLDDEPGADPVRKVRPAQARDGQPRRRPRGGAVKGAAGAGRGPATAGRGAAGAAKGPATAAKGAAGAAKGAAARGRVRSGQPGGAQPGGARPVGDQPVEPATVDQSVGAHAAGADQLTSGRPRRQRPRRQRARGERPTSDQPAGQQPSGDGSKGEQSSGEQSSGGQPTGGQPTGGPSQRNERPRGERPQRPRGAQPQRDQPRRDQPQRDQLKRDQRDQSRPSRPKPVQREPQGAVADAFRRAGWGKDGSK